MLVMDKLKLFVIWLDGFMEACGPELNEKQTNIIKDKLNGLFEHEAETINKPSLEELGKIHGFEVSSEPIKEKKDDVEYRC